MQVLSLAMQSISEVTSVAARVILEEGIVVYPTDTLYGIGVDATKDSCVTKLTKLKGRDENKPISVLVQDYNMLERYARIPDEHVQLLRKILPGQFTVILEAKKGLASNLSPDERVGFRIPDSEVSTEIVRMAGIPITTTSANVSGQPVLRSIVDIQSTFEDNVQLYIDAGKLLGEPSTVVDLTSHELRVIRKGPSIKLLEEAL